MFRHRNARVGGCLTIFLSAALMLGVSGTSGAAAAVDAPAEVVGVVADPCASAPTVKQAGGFLAWYRWTLAHDYGQLCVYRAANAKLGPPLPGTPRVVFMGDSITEIWKQRDPAFFADGRIDRGISGQTTSQMLVRFRQDVIDLHPAVVQILGGTNDIAGNTGATTLAAIEGNLADMAELAQAHGIRVILASVPPSAHFSWQPRVRPAQTIRELDAWIRGYARTHGCIYADYYAALATPAGAMGPGLSADGVHPTAKGYALMDPIALRAIAAALAQPAPR